ncbi:MAG: outer membrane protein assembly factor BamD [Pseudomonadota bacterium]
MKDFNRLLDDAQTDPLEAEILRLARVEAPSTESRRRILAGLGTSAAVGTVSRSSAGADKVGRAGAALKWACAGIVAVGASAAVLWLAQPAARPRLVTSTPMVAPLPPRPSAPASASNAPDSLPAPPPTLPKPADRAARSLAPRSLAQPGPSLAEEVAVIRSAKQALAAGDAAQALHELHVYQAHFPGGRLAQEANIVRIEALLKSGNRAAADAAADRFLAAHPDSPYAPRVHTLIGR